MPGAPPSASTSSPESSAMAGLPACAAALRAFRRAFSTNVRPVSSTSPMPSSPWEATCTRNSSRMARISASLPRLPVATTMLEPACSKATSSGGGQRLVLRRHQLNDAGASEIQQALELVAAEGVSLGGALHLDEGACVVHDDVHVGLGFGILGIVQVEHGFAPVDAHRDGGYLAVQRVLFQGALLLQALHRQRQGHVATRDRGGAGAPVGLQHVAVHGDSALAERGEIRHGAQRAADQTLYLLGAPALPAAGGLPGHARVRGAGQHAVLGGDPALLTPPEPGRHAVLHAGRAQHAGVAALDEDGALGVAGVIGNESQRMEAAVVLSLWGPLARTARSPSSRRFSTTA